MRKPAGAKLQLRTAEVFEPLLHPARYKGAHGGRGSGKSHFFGELAIEDALRFPGDHGTGMRMVALREVQKSLKESAKRLVEDKLSQFGLGEAQGFKVFREVIELPGDGLMIFTGMQDHTAESVKSLEGYHRAWCEESQALSERSLTLLRPTIRAADSQLWFSWNPRRPTDPVDKMLRGHAPPTGSVVVQANWSDNPWLPAVLDQERRDCLEQEPEKYPHVWGGEYATVLEGAYFALYLVKAQQEGRIGFFNEDPLLPVFAFWDIGGTGARADACAIWLVQFVGPEVRVLNYYEAVGQPFETHVYWLRNNGAGEDRARMVLPHDGRTHDKVFKATPEGFLRTAGFDVEVVPNQGSGAAMARIEAARRVFPDCRFNEQNTAAGREALGWYHEKKDPARNIGLGPNHDWASHGSDAFGLMSVYRLNQSNRSGWKSGQPIRRGVRGIA